MYYAQIDDNNVVYAVTQTAEPVNQSDMIQIESFNISLLGYTYSNGVFTPPQN